MILYLLSGVVFALGLSLSGMTNPAKVQSFLNLGSPDWSPALIFVLGAGVVVYSIAYRWILARQRDLGGRDFKAPTPRPIDRKLVLGSTLFGVGWGLAGVCPGPALVHVADLDTGFLTFLLMMFVGFETQRRFAS